MLLDGQQRLTTLYVLFKGKAPRFYEGESLFFDLHFNVQTQEFRFWQKSRMENNPAWIGVHEFLREGLAALLERLEQLDEERRTIVGQNLSRLSRHCALWQPERFLDFLAARRRLLAEAMNEFIAGWLPEKGVDPEQHVRELIAAGESDTLEFKSSLRWDRREDRVNKALEGVVVKTLAGFLNAAGGTLLIGVDDAGAPVGLAADYGTLKKQDRDGFELHLQNVLARDLGESAAASFLNVNFHEIDGQDICQITVEPSDFPIYVEHQKEAVFYLRVGPGTRALPVKEAVQYVGQRWGKTA